MFFGWGQSKLQKPIANDRAVILQYRYFALMFVFSFTFGYSYLLATHSADGWHYKALPKEQARQLLGGKELRPTIWRRFGLPITLVAIFVINLFTGFLRT